MSAAALWGHLVTMLAGRVGARLCWPGAGPRDRAAWHEAAHVLAGWWERIPAQSAAVVEGGGIVSWQAGREAASLRPGDVDNDAKVARRLIAALLTAAGAEWSLRAGLFLRRAAVREAEAGLRFEHRALARLGRELDRLGSLTAADMEQIRRETGAGRGLTPRERAEAGLPDLAAVLAEAAAFPDSLGRNAGE